MSKKIVADEKLNQYCFLYCTSKIPRANGNRRRKTCNICDRLNTNGNQLLQKSINQRINESINKSTNQSINESINKSTNQSMNQQINQ